jgi:hypothetical protein
VIAEILKIHIAENILDVDGKIDPIKMEQVARLGGDWYSKITQDSLFKVAKPLTTMGVGVDAIPKIFRNANFLTGNQLGKLGNVEQVPTLSVQEMQDLKIIDSESLQQKISHLTDADDLINAWKLMVANQN